MLLGDHPGVYRDAFFTAWQSFQANGLLKLTPMEQMIVTVIQKHPEYHVIFNHSEQYQHYTDTGFSTNHLNENPFLHLGMHIALIEHIQCDRPFGFRACYQQLRLRHEDEHALEHQVMGIIADTMWEAIHRHQAIDEKALLLNIGRL